MKNQIFFEKVRKHYGKGEKAGEQHFFPFHTMFSKGIFLRSLTLGLILLDTILPVVLMSYLIHKKQVRLLPHVSLHHQHIDW